VAVSGRRQPDVAAGSYGLHGHGRELVVILAATGATIGVGGWMGGWMAEQGGGQWASWHWRQDCPMLTAAAAFVQ
jgi:hypothetical protein